MERYSFKRMLEFRIRGRTFTADFGLKVTDEEPDLPKSEPVQPKAVVKREVIGDYVPTTSGHNFVIRTYRTSMRVEIDPFNRTVQADGRMTWVETNYDNHRYGWAPDAVSYLRSDEPPAEEVLWRTEYNKDKHGNLMVNVILNNQPLRVAINAKQGYVVVWDAAIKAMYKSRYMMVGPKLPVSVQFSEMVKEERPKVVHIEQFRSAAGE
jgi:hypothetical protein